MRVITVRQQILVSNRSSSRSVITIHHQNTCHVITNITKLPTFEETHGDPEENLCCCYCWLLRHFLTSYVISVASDIERDKSDKFCSEALILAWGSFTCHKSTTRDPRLYFPSEGSHTQDFYALEKIHQIEPTNLRSSGEYDNHWTTRVDSTNCLLW